MSSLTVTCSGNPAENVCNYFHPHCQAGGWTRTDCTVFVDDRHTLLESEAPPWMVFCDWAICVHCEILHLGVFVKWEAWSMKPFCQLAILGRAIPSFLAGVSYKWSEISLGTFPILWFAWAQSAGILEVLIHQLGPSSGSPRTSLCPVSFMTSWSGLSEFSTALKWVCFDLLHFMSGLH